MACRPYGAYRVDAEVGLIYGKRGHPVGTLDTSGYIQIGTLVDGHKIMRRAHRWIWEHVHGPIPADKEINHINGVKTDNRIANLELVTHQQNIQHAYDTGLKTNAGVKHPRSRLTEKQVYEIRRLADSGVPHLEIAPLFDIRRRQVNDIARRKAWAHLPELTRKAA